MVSMTTPANLPVAGHWAQRVQQLRESGYIFQNLGAVDMNAVCRIVVTIDGQRRVVCDTTAPFMQAVEACIEAAQADRDAAVRAFERRAA
jgi:hypothetical protein